MSDRFDGNLPVKVYKRVSPEPGAPLLTDELMAKYCVYLPDSPGSLAGFASAIAGTGSNISFFHYDRSIDSNRVAVEVQLDHAKLAALLRSLSRHRYVFERAGMAQDEVQITAVESVLEIKVRLVNTPGALAAFANLLKEHNANVIYMLYDEDIEPEAADIALATRSPEEIEELLNAINRKGYYYRVIYRGADAQEASHIIGLKMAEKFFLRLKRVLGSSDLEEIKSLVASSKDLHSDLVHFYAEAGNDLEAGDVFEKVLALASRSRSRVGDRFAAVEMPPLAFEGGVTLYGFRVPTSENFYLFRHADGEHDELTMIDAAHGVYFEDIKRLLRSRSLDPAAVRRILVTHPDTDHIGTAGYFEREFGAEVFVHPGSIDVIQHMNRAYGTSGRLANLNKYYTRLSNAFTACRFPEHPRYFETDPLGRIGSFDVIARIGIGPLTFEVLESHGGHAPGQVFYLNRAYGLLFTSDFLINVPSLSPDEREHLSLYRYLLTNPNSNTQVYKEELAALKEIIASLDAELKQSGRPVLIFPGHGDYYRAEELAK
ncbi:MAG: MBL fold metallo-hydrolase [Nitrospirota bacterium]